MCADIVDRLTILEIKLEKISDPTKLEIVRTEIESLGVVPDVGPFKNLLYKINQVLWEVEDKLRELEEKEEFDQEFILLARSVYFTNDLRSRVKTQISKILGEKIREIKSYKGM